MNRFPDFGKEVQRPFPVDERCYDCVEFYGPGHGMPGCNAWPANRPGRCSDYFQLPDVMPGTSGTGSVTIAGRSTKRVA